LQKYLESGLHASANSFGNLQGNKAPVTGALFCAEPMAAPVECAGRAQAFGLHEAFGLLSAAVVTAWDMAKGV
jgi:hypothetical protein